MGMNRVVFQSAPVMGGSTSGGWWNLNNNNNNMRGSPSDLTSSSTTPLLPSPSLYASLHDYPYHPSTNPLPNSSPNWQDSHQDLPESWSQLLLGGLVEGDGRGSFPSFQAPVLNPHMVDVKQERPGINGYMYGQGSEEFQLAVNKASWNQIPPVSSPSPRSSVTSFSSNMLDFSNIKADGRQKRPDNSPECNSTAAASAFKKARIQGSSSAQSTFKVRKEKLGDRITSLHQLVSPFGKTDTASVLQEAIGYIRFLQSQIEALSSPYLGNATHTNTPGNSRSTGQGERSCIFPEDPGQLLNDAFMKSRRSTDQKEGEENEEVQKKDLKSRGLCLVPISCTMHIGSDNGADYWAPALGSAFL